MFETLENEIADWSLLVQITPQNEKELSADFDDEISPKLSRGERESEQQRPDREGHLHAGQDRRRGPDRELVADLRQKQHFEVRTPIYIIIWDKSLSSFFKAFCS